MDCIAENVAYSDAERCLARSADGFTSKLSVGMHDLYVKVALDGERIIFVDITLGHANGHMPSYIDAISNELATQRLNDSRSMLEVICRQASTLLQSGVWDTWRLISSWRATQFEPSGVCEQLNTIVSSPLDAVARLLEKRTPR